MKKKENYPGDQAGGKIPSSPSSGSNFGLYIISHSWKGYSNSKKKLLKHPKEKDDKRRRKRLTSKKQRRLIFYIQHLQIF